MSYLQEIKAENPVITERKIKELPFVGDEFKIAQNLLEKINSPKDLKLLAKPELKQLSKEIRDRI